MLMQCLCIYVWSWNFIWFIFRSSYQYRVTISRPRKEKVRPLDIRSSSLLLKDYMERSQDPFLWGSCSPLAHCRDTVCGLLPQAQWASGLTACLFLVILVNRDNLLACSFRNFISSGHKEILASISAKPIQSPQTILIYVGGLTEVLNSGWWWQWVFGLTITQFLLLKTQAHTVSWSLWNKPLLAAGAARGHLLQNTNHLWTPFFTSTSPSGLHYAFVWVDQSPLQILTWKQEAHGGSPLEWPLHAPFGSETYILISHLLKLTGPETLAMRCFWRLWFYCHSSLVVFKSNYMFQMMKSTVMESWHSSQGDRCIQTTQLLRTPT